MLRRLRHWSLCSFPMLGCTDPGLQFVPAFERVTARGHPSASSGPRSTAGTPHWCWAPFGTPLPRAWA